jgi:hypothetical protein
VPGRVVACWVWEVQAGRVTIATVRKVLEEEGSRVGAHYRLGASVGSWSGRDLRPKFAYGVMIVLGGIVFGWIPVALISAHYRPAAAGALGGLLLGGFLVACVPPRWQRYGLFRFEYGLVFCSEKAAPAVLFWDDLAWVRLSFGRAELTGHSGQRVEITGRLGATEQILAVAEKVLLPELTARYDSGEPACLGGLLVIDRRGLSVRSQGSGLWCPVSWQETGRVVVSEHGDQVEVHRSDGISEAARLRGAPNSFLARHLIEHAARRAGVAVPVEQASPPPASPADRDWPRIVAVPKDEHARAAAEGHRIGTELRLGAHLESHSLGVKGTPQSRQHGYEGGAVTVAEGRITVVRLASLASLSTGIGDDDESTWVSYSSLTDQAGATVDTLSGNLKGRAEQILLDRHLGPLTARFDAGQPVTIGCLTVDQRGISCRARGRRGPWDVSWPEVSQVVARFQGLLVTVATRRDPGHGALRGELDDEPNGFLAAYLLQYAARQAGVPFRAFSGYGQDPG